MHRARDVLLDARWAPYVFLLPFLLIFIVFRVWPTVSAVLISGQKFAGTDSLGYVGVANYSATLINPRFAKALGNTVFYTLGTLLILIPLPLILAALLDSGRVVKETMFRVALFLPALTSLVVVSVLFRIVLARDGLLNAALGQAGVPSNAWLETSNLAVPSMII